MFSTLTVFGAFTESADTDHVTDHVNANNISEFEKLSPVAKLIYVLGNDSLSLKELMERLHLSHKPTFRHNYLTPALEQHLIEMTIPDKPKSRLQKYRKAKV